LMFLMVGILPVFPIFGYIFYKTLFY
jgi:hypothetical protein